MTTEQMNGFENIRTNPSLWQHWGRWNQVMLFTSPWSEAMRSETMKKLGVHLTGNMKVLHGHFYLFKDDLGEVCRVTNKGGTEWYEEYFKQCERAINQFSTADTTPKTFIKEITEILACSVLTEFCDECLSEQIKALCKQEELEFADVFSLMTPDRKNLLMQYQEELKAVDEESIDTFVERWKWVGTHALEGEPLTKEKAWEAKKDIEQNQSTKTKQSDLQVENKKLQEYIQIGKELAYYRSQLMDVINKNSYRYRDVLSDVAQQYGLTYFEFTSLTDNEIIQLLDDKREIPEDVSQRQKKFGYININEEEKILLGDDLQKELQLHEEKQEIKDTIEGTIANKGVVRGKVVVVKNVADCEKVKSGDILVAPETTPDYIFAMRRAAAFVTNQGGITSHAAIISRELGVPCVIGTQHATESLHDGDEVEVDANNGVIKKV